MTVREKLGSLIDAANGITGAAAETVTEAMQNLKDGYGKGGAIVNSSSVGITPIQTVTGGSFAIDTPKINCNYGGLE